MIYYRSLDSVCIFAYCCLFFLVFFFFKQKTAYEMRISDWSSDVCSSDLSWADARVITGVDQIVGQPALVPCEHLQRLMHHFAGWLITPDEIERRREREFKSSRSHQNGTIDPVGMGDHEGERHAAAEGIYEHRDLVDFQIVEKTDQDRKSHT